MQRLALLVLLILLTSCAHSKETGLTWMSLEEIFDDAIDDTPRDNPYR